MADELHAHPATIVFNTIQGHQSSATRSIFVFSALGTVLNWSETVNVAWLSANPGTGTTDGVLNINVNNTGMQPGVYQGNVVIDSPQSATGPVIIGVTLIINPDVPVSVTTWKNGYDGAMSVSTDDSQPSGFGPLQANGFSGTFVMEGLTVPSFYTPYYNAGMELGSHTVNHPCSAVSDDVLRHTELEPNIAALIAGTPEPAKDVITFVWPCGYTNFREQAVTTDYFLSARGYNINQLEDPTPNNFMNLKSYNSHESYPFPPPDLKTVVDAAILQKKWFNLVLHNFTNDDGAINYAHTKNIWVTSIGTVIKYILQRDRFILTDFNQTTNTISCNLSRLEVPASSVRSFEPAFGVKDSVTMQFDIDDSRIIGYVTVNGIMNNYRTKVINGNKVLLTNVRLVPGVTTAVTIQYQQLGVSLTGVTVNSKVYDGTKIAILNTTNAQITGIKPGDVVSLVSTGGTGTFTDKNVGTNKTVIISGFALSGPDAGKYMLIEPALMSNIMPIGLTITGVTATNKVYNGSAGEILRSGHAGLAGIISTDNVSLDTTNVIARFTDKKAGKGKQVIVSGFRLNGPDAANYTLTQPLLTADINPLPLTITGIIANDKIYNGTTAETLKTGHSRLSGRFGRDDVRLDTTSLVGMFTDSNVGNNKQVTIGAFKLYGSDASDYTLAQPFLTADISPAVLTITAENQTRNYGEENPVLTIDYSGFAQGQDQSVLYKPAVAETAASINSHTGNYDITVSGAVDSNYNFIYNPGKLTIIKADQVISFEEIPSGLRMTQSIQLKATATSGLPVSFRLTGSYSILDSNILEIKKEGNLTITAYQPGNDNWNPAPDVSQSIKTLPTFDGISSLFTPNNDGVNDFWYIPYIEDYGKVQVTVYNRNGQEVYKSDNYENNWDGTWNGRPLPSAAYYYILRSSTKGFIKGVVNIVR